MDEVRNSQRSPRSQYSKTEDTHMPPMVTVAQVRSGKAGMEDVPKSVAAVAALM